MMRGDSWILLLLLVAVPASGGVVCAGDCNGDGRVTISELIEGVNELLRPVQDFQCEALDVDRNGIVAINELVLAVSHALHGCPSSE